MTGCADRGAFGSETRAPILRRKGLGPRRSVNERNQPILPPGGGVSRAADRGRYLVLTPGMTGADGIAGVSRLIVRALHRDEVRILSFHDHPGPLASATACAGLRVWAAGGRRLPFVAFALRMVAGTPPAEVICMHLALSPVAWLAAGTRGRLTVFLHGIEAWKPLETVQRWVLGRAGVLMTNSEHTARRFRDANPALAGRQIRVCHPGLETVRATNEERSETGALPFALIVGRMAAAERYKGHDLLLDIWPRVVAEVPEARLVVAGDGDDRGRLEAKARVLEEHVTFLGHATDRALAAAYRDCAFFVMPSRDEGFGLVYLEAMRAGKACIGGVGAAAEVIEDGVTGLVVDPTKPEPTLEAVLRLFREPGTRARMGVAGAARFARHFTEAHFRCRFRAALGLPPALG
jgi:phosphatidylinositol alpha-1,6-mannosyltransferase